MKTHYPNYYNNHCQVIPPLNKNIERDLHCDITKYYILLDKEENKTYQL